MQVKIWELGDQDSGPRGSPGLAFGFKVAQNPELVGGEGTGRVLRILQPFPGCSCSLHGRQSHGGEIQRLTQLRSPSALWPWVSLCVLPPPPSSRGKRAGQVPSWTGAENSQSWSLGCERQHPAADGSRRPQVRLLDPVWINRPPGFPEP